MTTLQELCLADPFWGECPVARLCNYQTFMLYLMPHLTSLDTLLLAEETKAAAVATFTKKQLYYNMRIRTLRRAAAGLAQQAKAGCQVRYTGGAALLHPVTLLSTLSTLNGLTIYNTRLGNIERQPS